MLYKLSDGTSSVDIDPTRGLNVSENRIRDYIQKKDGKPDTYEFGSGEEYQIPLINIKQDKASQLFSWWEDQEVLTFTPDQASSGDTIQMIIDGVEKPLDVWHHLFDSKYAGTLILHEVSSQSFSSSHVSVSRSESCSSFTASESCSTGSSTSCSVDTISTSGSWSTGWDDSWSTSRSCSTSVSSSDSRTCSTFSSSLGYPWNQYQDFSFCTDITVPVTLSSCSNISSKGSSQSSGEIDIDILSTSCSLDPSSTSCSESAGGISCSNSAGGIS